MAAVISAGVGAILYISGASAAFGGEAAMTEITANTVYQLTPGVPLVVLSPTTTISTNGTGVYTTNRLTNTLTFVDDQAANEPIHLDAAVERMPLSALLYAKDFSFKITPKVVDTTVFNGGIYESRKRTLMSVSGTIGTFFTPDSAETPAFAPEIPGYFLQHITDDAVFAIKFYISADFYMLAWVKVDTEALAFAIDGLNEEVVSFSGYPDADGRELALVIA